MLRTKHTVGRNEPCPCESGLKFKYCHGDPLKVAVCNRVANEKMVELIYQEKIKKGLIKLPYHCNGCGKDFIELKVSSTGGMTQYNICPFCSSPDFIEN
jgi:DNA-directed RNA polymerase subunit RPC12/RpoP